MNNIVFRRVSGAEMASIEANKMNVEQARRQQRAAVADLTTTSAAAMLEEQEERPPDTTVPPSDGKHAAAVTRTAVTIVINVLIPWCTN